MDGLYVNQHDEDYLMKTTSDLALRRRCYLLSNYFDLLFYLIYDLPDAAVAPRNNDDCDGGYAEQNQTHC